ncbi:MAG: flagellin [Opitutales bacterium]|nr:flagellin [Opitutales bacterium]
MELTNFSYLNARNDYKSSLAESKPIQHRLATGKKLVGSNKDIGAIAQSTGIRSDRLQMNSRRVTLQNFITFLDSQQKNLEQVRGIYNRMSILSHKALDPTFSESANSHQSDKELLNKEFNELSNELDGILARKVNGQLLFGGKSADFTDGLLDEVATGATPQMISIDVGTTKGKMTIELSPGMAPDQIWMFQGDLPANLSEYFDASTYLNNGNFFDPTDTARLQELNTRLDDAFDQNGIFTTGPWQTQGSADALNYDQFEVEFNTCDVKVTPSFHANNGAFGATLYGNLTANNSLRTNVPTGDSTTITMIGVNAGNTAIYRVKANFEPSLPYNDLEVPGSSEIYPAISFGNIDCSNINTSAKAKKVLENLQGELENLNNSMAQVAASQRRYENEIHHMEDMEIVNEVAAGKIADSDYANEATELAKKSIKMGLAAQVMSNSANLKDVLIPLTTEHFRSNILRSTL